MTKYPADMDPDDIHAFNDETDTRVVWSCQDDERDGTTRSTSVLTGNLLGLDVDVDVNDGEKTTTVHVRLAAPVGHVPWDPDDRERLYQVQQALADGKDVSIDGEPVDDVLGWD